MNANPNPNLYVIVVTFKGRQWYDHCFQSLRASTIPVHTIVVDNASNDGTVKFIHDNYPEIILIESHENLGFGRANNLGMKYSLDHGCDFVFLLNQDAWVEPDTFEQLLKVYSDHSEFGILSPMHLTAEKDSIESGLLSFLNDKENTDGSLLNDLYFGRLKDCYETKYIHAAAWLLPRYTLEIVGGFDPIFLHYGEDDNYIQRVLYHGMKIAICPMSRVVHDTVRRLPKNIGNALTTNKDLLVQLANVNRKESLSKVLWFFRRKMVAKALRFDFVSYRIHKENAAFLRKNKGSIKYSRQVNRNKGMNWL